MAGHGPVAPLAGRPHAAMWRWSPPAPPAWTGRASRG